jgi:polygalacturonase
LGRSVTAEDHAGRNGRIKFGTESNGGFKNIAIANCIFDGGHGLALETVDGGDLEDVTVSNLTLRHVIGPAIFLRLGSRMRGPAGTPVGHLRRIHISGITIYDPGARYACLIAGIPGHPIEEVSLSQVHLIHPGGGTAEEAGRDVPERETAYPEPEMLGPLPAYGLYARHVRALTVSDSDFALQSGDARPAIVLDDVENARLRSIDTSDPAAGAGTVLLRRSRNIRFDHVGSVADARLDSAAEKRL